MAYSLSGYKALSVTQLANIFAVLVNDLERFDAFRLLCGYLYLEAKQDATERSLKKAGHAIGPWDGPSVTELRRVVGGRKSINRLWQSLEKAGLIIRTERRVVVTETPLPMAEPYLGLICGLDELGGFKRSTTRAVPIPRDWLRAWAKPTRSKMITLLHLFYCAACLSFKNKKSGEVKTAATFKFEKLISFSGLNRSRLTSARRKLIEEKRISPDTTRYQRKLNRDGHFAAVQLDWHRASTELRQPETGRPTAQNCSPTGHPDRDKKQALLVVRDQKRSGVFAKQNPPAPNPSNLQQGDLWSIKRLRELFRKQRWIEKTKSNFLYFVSAAVKARSVGDNPVKLFVWLVREKRKEFISQAHEDVALAAIRKLREIDSDVSSWQIEQGLAPSVQSMPYRFASKERLRVRELVMAELAKLNLAEATGPTVNV